MLLTNADGYAILHKRYAEIHLKNKVYKIDYSQIWMVEYEFGRRFWRIVRYEGQDKKDYLRRTMFMPSNDIAIDRALGFRKCDPLKV